MFKKILIANRGEIACRVMRTARRMGITTVAVYSEADAQALHVETADEAFPIGPPPVTQSYLNVDAIIAACRASGAEAVHPGYGFLSENPEFVEAVTAAGLRFIGPSAASIRAMGLKDAAKALMENADVPVVPGYHGDAQDPGFLAEQADKIGYPVLIKARAGGGGKGMRRVDDPKDFASALEGAQREGQSSFGDGRVLIEKYLTKPRHIEVQVFGDDHGNAIHLGERDCSLQRRHQKVIEEAPAPGMSDEMRRIMGDAAVKAARAIDYSGAGTIEFIADVSEGLRPDRFFFMEMNTRLQVEHPVTECITGLDLVEWQLRVASGEPLPLAQDQVSLDGWAFEARVYAENPKRNFLPATGRLAHLSFPQGDVRIDTGVRQGDSITPHYDPMIAKVIVHGGNRAQALNKLSRALDDSHITGTVTNVAFLGALARHPRFASGDVDTGLIDQELAALNAEADAPPEATALAAVAVLGMIPGPQPKAPTDPWDTLTGWRLWNTAHRSTTIRQGDETIEASVAFLDANTFDVSWADQQAQLRLDDAGDGTLHVTTGTRRSSARVVHSGSRLTIFWEGRTFDFEMPDPLAGRAEDEAGGDRVVAPMPGLVKLVSVEAGQKVSKGADVAIMEAMKMEYKLTAPMNGTIGQVLVKAGEQVEEGALLITFAE